MEKNVAIENARKNLLVLRDNPYPGRGIISGLNEARTKIFQIYWLMGRGVDSRNRIFVEEDDGYVRTDLADPNRMPADTNLIIYCAMMEDEEYYVVSNGRQTRDILSSMLDGASHYEGLQHWQYEPDAPNYTPRITASYSLEEKSLEISIIKKSSFGLGCDCQMFRYEKLSPGIGYGITTYEGDGNPLPPFRGEPFPIPLEGTAEEVAKALWANLNPDNRVALAIKAIDVATGESSIHIINKYQAVS